MEFFNRATHCHTLNTRLGNSGQILTDKFRFTFLLVLYGAVYLNVRVCFCYEAKRTR